MSPLRWSVGWVHGGYARLVGGATVGLSLHATCGGGDRGGRRHRAWRRLVVRMVRLGRDGLNLRILGRQGEYDESTLDDFTDAVGPRGQHCRADVGSLLPELRGCPERIGGSANSSYAKPRTNTGLRSRHLLYGERERVGHNAHHRGARPAGDQPDGNAMRSGERVAPPLRIPWAGRRSIDPQIYR